MAIGQQPLSEAYQCEAISPANRDEAETFVRQHESYCVNLLDSYLSHGAKLGDSPYSGNFKLLRNELGEIAAVFALLRRKWLVLFATEMSDELCSTIQRENLREEIPLVGIAGKLSCVSPLWNYLKDNAYIHPPYQDQPEACFLADLRELSLQPQNNVRFLNEEDLDMWLPLRQAALVELNVSHLFTAEQLTTRYRSLVPKLWLWGVFASENLVGIAQLNGRSFTIGQLGGIYILPSYRRLGLAKALVQQVALDLRETHCLEKIMGFTPMDNAHAQALYKGMGAQQLDDYALFNCM
jgi:aminoglycoside 6'-N-acetyltransferase I